MATSLKQLPWESCLFEPRRNREFESWLKREVGSAPGWTRYLDSSRWFAKAMTRFQFDQRLVPALDGELPMRVMLVVSQENSCRYCYAMLRMMLRLFGVSEARMQELEQHLADSRELSPRLLAAVRFTRIVNRGNPLHGSAEREALAQTAFSADEIKQLAFLVVSMGMMNRFCTAVALAPQFVESMSSHWLLGIIHPLASRLLQHLPKPRLPSASAQQVLPRFPALVDVYAGSPIARLLEDTLADMWLSQTLGPRDKLLIIATITQGIHCNMCRAEVTRLAAAEGLEAEALFTAIAHLDSAALTEKERVMLEFARESLWYQPQKLQLRAQALHRMVGTSVFVEMLGVVIIANMFTRLAATMVDAR